jgi:hypothetical protein
MCTAILATPPPRIWAHIRGRYWSAKIDTSLCTTAKKLWFSIQHSILSASLLSSLCTLQLLAILFPFNICNVVLHLPSEYCPQGVTKRCRLSWLTNSALVCEPKWGVGGGGLRGLSQWLQLCKWSPNKLWRSNSILYLTYDCPPFPVYFHPLSCFLPPPPPPPPPRPPPPRGGGGAPTCEVWWPPGGH